MVLAAVKVGIPDESIGGLGKQLRPVLLSNLDDRHKPDRINTGADEFGDADDRCTGHLGLAAQVL